MVDVKPVRAVDRANIDPTVSPADDFYRYASGTWLKNNPIPEEYSRWGCFEELHEKSQAHIKQILEGCADAAAAGSARSVHEKLAGVLYSTGMDEKARETAGMEPMEDVYAAINEVGSPADCFVLSARLKREFGMPAAGFWSMYDSVDAKNSSWTVMYVSQAGLGIGDRDYYVSDDPTKKEIREKYLGHVARTLTMAGVDGAVNEKAAAVLALETKMAEAHLTKVEKRDPHLVYNKFSGPTTLATETESTSTPWAQYFTALGLEGEDFGGLVLDNVKLAKRMAELLADPSVALDTWKCYLTYHVTKAMAPFLSGPAVEENFSFHVKVMTGQPKMKPLWKRVSAQVGSCVEESLGILYVEKHFSPEAKKTCHEMCDYLVDVLAARFDHETGVSWMSAETKTRALEKLKAFRYKIGCV